MNLHTFSFTVHTVWVISGHILLTEKCANLLAGAHVSLFWLSGRWYGHGSAWYHTGFPIHRLWRTCQPGGVREREVCSHEFSLVSPQMHELWVKLMYFFKLQHKNWCELKCQRYFKPYWIHVVINKRLRDIKWTVM